MLVLHVGCLGLASLLAKLVDLVCDGGLQAVHALAGERADAVHLRVDGARRELVAAGSSDGISLDLGLQALQSLFGACNVDLVGNHDARTRRQLVGVERQLVVDDLVIIERVAALPVAREVDHVHDERGALDMAEELVSQAAPLVRSLDETGDVGHDEAQIARARHAQVGHERGERVIGDLRACRRDLRDKRAFAGRGHAHKRRVGHKLHLKLDPALLRRLAQLGERRRATRRGDEVDVAAATHAAVCHGDALAVVGKVGHELAGFLGFLEVFVDHGAHRHLEHQIVARGAVHAAALAVRAALCLEVVLEAIVDQRGHAGIGFKHHVAAMAAVAAVGTALGNMGLAAKRHAAGAAVAALDVDSDLINEHDVTSIGFRIACIP